jgi:imidazolonepropionase-like amidohydrolase
MYCYAMRFGIVVLLFLGSASRLLSQTKPTPIAITNVTVIDVIGGVSRQGMTVLVRDDRIDRVAAKVKIPRGATHIDGSGKFLIPGLWDMHSHHQANGADWVDLFVAKGVVGTRDMGADADFIFPLRERIQSGAVIGPDIVASGPMVDDAPEAFPYRLHVKTAEQAREAVRQLKKEGADFIKVHDHTPRDVFFAVADETKKVGMTFAGHVPISVTPEEAVDAGIHSIEHLANDQLFDKCVKGDTYKYEDCAKFIDKLAAKGVWETPTMAFFETIPDVFAGAPLAHAEYASDALLETTRMNVEGSHLDAKTLNLLREAGRQALQAVDDMHRHGNQFLAGCDALVPGFCLHDELEWLTKAKFTPLEALQTATINPARFLGREKTQGSVDAGKRADLVLLDADPLLDVRNVARIDSVILRGKLFKRPEIDGIVARHRRLLPKVQ